jgi:hypothetical protein
MTNLIVSAPVRDRITTGYGYLSPIWQRWFAKLAMNIQQLITSVIANAHHGDLQGLEDDDHPQYLTQSRADSRYISESTANERYLPIDGSKPLEGWLVYKLALTRDTTIPSGYGCVVTAPEIPAGVTLTVDGELVIV